MVVPGFARNRTHKVRFRLFGFPVQVDPSFAIVAALLGMARADLWGMGVWVAVVFVSILVHELGHATVARAQGCRPSITLFSMGGLTQWSGGPALGPLRQVGISLAGPFAGFAFGSVVFVIGGALPAEAPYYAHLAIFDLLWVNFGWGLLNLLPVLPLDGGHVLRSLLHAARRRDDERLPLQVSIAVGAVATAAALLYGMLFAAMLAGWITWNNYTALRRIWRSEAAPGPPG